MTLKVKTRAKPGFEPGTSCTQSRNHTPRPFGRHNLSSKINLPNPKPWLSNNFTSEKRYYLAAVGFEPTPPRRLVP